MWSVWASVRLASGGQRRIFWERDKGLTNCGDDGTIADGQVVAQQEEHIGEGRDSDAQVRFRDFFP